MLSLHLFTPNNPAALLPKIAPQAPKNPVLFLDDLHREGDEVFVVRAAGRPGGAGATSMEARADRSDQRFGRRSRTLPQPVQVTSIAGWGFPTDILARLRASGDLRLETSHEGDGTIPFVSATWLNGPGVSTFAVPVGFYPGENLREKHTTLWETPPAQDLLAEILGGAPHQDYAYAAIDGDDAVNQRPEIRVRLVALDGAGNPLPNARARFLDLRAPGPVSFPFQAGGRGEVAVPRNRIRTVQGGRLLRFQLSIEWDGGTKGPLAFAFQR